MEATELSASKNLAKHLEEIIKNGGQGLNWDKKKEMLLNLRDATGVDRGEILPISEAELDADLDRLGNIFANRQIGKKINLFKKVDEKRMTSIDNRALTPQGSDLESCETPKCMGVVRGRQRFCDECKKKKELEKMPKGKRRKQYSEDFWKEILPVICSARDNNKMSFVTVVKKFQNQGILISEGTCYKKAKDFGISTKSGVHKSIIIPEKFKFLLEELPVNTVLEPVQMTVQEQVSQELMNFLVNAVTPRLREMDMDRIESWVESLKSNPEDLEMLTRVKEIIDFRHAEITEEVETKRVLNQKLNELEAQREKLLSELGS